MPLMRSEVPVLRLSWLGFRFIAGIVGLMKDDAGDEGSDIRGDERELNGG